MALHKPEPGKDGPGPQAPGAGPPPSGSSPPPPGFGVNLLASIHRQLLADAQPDDPGPGVDLHPGPGDPAPAGLESAPPAAGDPGDGDGDGIPEHIRAIITEKARHRRLQRRARRVTTDAGPAVVKAKLRTLAKAAGLPCLPGAGSLTLAARKLSRQNVVQYIRLAASDGDLHCQTWLHVWEDLKAWEQKAATLDDVCAAAGINPVRIIKAVVGSAYEAGVDVANFVAAVAHPDVVEKGIQYAKEKDGIEDRKLLYLHHQFIPQPKGTTINVSSVSGSVAQAQAAGSDSSVPSFLEDVEAIVEPKEAVQKLLIAADPEPAA